MNIWQKIETTEIKDKNNELLNVLKKEYNHNLERMYKAERYYSLPTTTADMVDKTLNDFNQIIYNLSTLQRNYEEITGNKISREKMFNGF